MVFLSCVGIGSYWLLVSICAEFPASFFAFIRLFGTLLLLIEIQAYLVPLSSADHSGLGRSKESLGSCWRSQLEALPYLFYIRCEWRPIRRAKASRARDLTGSRFRRIWSRSRVLIIPAQG
ncbi:uncharacterized protein [Nicotiana sylvestris]|uniref:uncharacterized protein n=1 Tax=Nicotiana sylvestris TaxID=4096 RepID=UPI00388CBBC8